MRYNSEGNGASKKSLQNYKVIRIGDVAFEGHTNKEFQYGRFVVNSLGNGIMSPRFAVLRPIQPTVVNFWKYYLHNERSMNRILVRATKAGTMMNELVYSDLAKEKIKVPIEKEQLEIGNLFSILDRTITLHEEKQRQLEQLKKALLQKMFVDKSGYPELGFKGFADIWEQRQLGEIGSTFSGLSGKNKEDFGHGNARFITYMNVYSNPIANPKGTEHIEIDPKQHQVKFGDILFTTSSETPEEVGMSSVWLSNDENVYLNSFCFGYRVLSNQKINPYYMAYLLRSDSFRRKVTLLAQGISRYNISKKHVMGISISFPALEEQKKVGRLFQKLDQTITFHAKKIEQLKQLKQALLQKMFV